VWVVCVLSAPTAMQWCAVVCSAVVCSLFAGFMCGAEWMSECMCIDWLERAHTHAHTACASLSSGVWYEPKTRESDWFGAVVVGTAFCLPLSTPPLPSLHSSITSSLSHSLRLRTAPITVSAQRIVLHCIALHWKYHIRCGYDMVWWCGVVWVWDWKRRVWALLKAID